MAIFKCKMCGGDLELVEGSSVATCEYCGTTQTVPTADNEKKMTLFGRANRLLRACEFDKAAGVYESIVSEFPEEAEAYWGLVLCKYGIEYVDDPATGKKIPTCHRSSFDSVLDDDNFEQASENADAVARKVYREEAKAIEELRRGIIEVSGKEEPYDIFICYKETAENGGRTLDSVLAQDIYDALTEKGYRVFFSRVTLEDKLGQEYEPYIFAALNSAKIMLAVGTDYEYYNAVWVKNEWSRFLHLIAAGQKKVLIPCFKGLDPYDMPKEFAKLQSQDLGKVGAMQDLLRGIEKIMGGGKTEAPSPAAQTVVVQGGGPNVSSLIERGNIELEDNNWDKATELFDQALSLDPKCGEAYLGLFMADEGLESWAALKTAYADSEDKFADEKRFARARQYAGAELAKQFEELDAAWGQKQKNRAKASNREAGRLAAIRKRIEPAGKLIAAGSDHTVGLRTDGTVVAVGRNDRGQCDVSDWTDIVAVAAGSSHTVGLKSDGTAVAAGANTSGQCNVSDWTDVVAVAAGISHTVGLRSDGTAVAAGYNKSGQCDVSGWTDIVAVAVGQSHTVGLRSDGTVVAVGSNDYDQCKVNGWKNIVAIYARGNLTVGLKSNGKVITEGLGYHGSGDVDGWENIIAISIGSSHAVGIRSDGTVRSTSSYNTYTPGPGAWYPGQCEVNGWKDIVAVAAGSCHTVGLRSDGTVVATEIKKPIYKLNNKTIDYGQSNVSGWKLFNSLDTLEQERKTARLAAEERRRAEEEERQRLKKEQDSLQSELANLKGLFTGKRRKEIEARLSEIERSLK